MSKRALRSCVAVFVLALVILVPAGVAAADEYPAGDPPQVQNYPGDPTYPGDPNYPGDPGSSSTLPVTGGEITGLVLIGLVVLGAGVLLVRLNRRPARV